MFPFVSEESQFLPKEGGDEIHIESLGVVVGW